jgi:hypothetical protein
MATIADNAVHNGIETNGRKADGRFAPGNKLARGNPIHRRMYRYRRALYDAASIDNIKNLFNKLYELGMAGDVMAIRIYLEYCAGKPHQIVELDFSERSMNTSRQAMEQAQRELDQWNLEQKARLIALLETPPPDLNERDE